MNIEKLISKYFHDGGRAFNKFIIMTITWYVLLFVYFPLENISLMYGDVITDVTVEGLHNLDACSTPMSRERSAVIWGVDVTS